MNNIRFAVIGAGHIGKRHASMVLRNEECELAALCDIRPKAELGLDEFGDTPFFASLDKLLASGIDFDVACICTPNGFHAEQAKRLLDARRHVVVEKPMGLTKGDCEEIIFKSLNVSRHVFCVMQNRYSPPSAWIKEVIENKTLGNIHMVQVNCYWNRDDRYYKAGGWKGSRVLDGGTLFTQFSHFIDIMFWLFGDIEDIKASFADFTHQQSTEFEDSGLVQFRFKKGGMGCINYSTAVWDTNFESSITVIGSKGTVKIGGQYMNEVEYCHIQDYAMPELPPANPANDYGPYKGSAANHNYIFDNVINSLKGGEFPTTNALEGLKVVEIIENIYAQNPYFRIKFKD